MRMRYTKTICMINRNIYYQVNMKYFTIKELTKTYTGVSNIPNAERLYLI